jgi:hypothetical protein
LAAKTVIVQKIKPKNEIKGEDPRASAHLNPVNVCRTLFRRHPICARADFDQQRHI